MPNRLLDRLSYFARSYYFKLNRYYVYYVKIEHTVDKEREQL